MFRLVGSHITKRLHHVNLFLQNPMKECIPHIKLPKWPVVSHCKSKDQSNSWRLDNWTKSLFKIYSILLVKSFGYHSCLITRNGTIIVSFELEDPLASNNVFANGWRDQGPSMLSLKSWELFIHGSAPLGIFGSKLVGRWFYMSVVSWDGMVNFGFENAMLGTSLHGMSVKCGRDRW